MLVLTRKPREEIRIGDGITITVLRVKGQSVRIGIQAPSDMRIVRGELEVHSTEQDAEGNTTTRPMACQVESCETKSSSTSANAVEERSCRSLPQPMAGGDCPARLPRTTRSSSTLKILAARRRAMRDAQTIAAPMTSMTDEPTIPLRNHSPK